MWTPNINGFYPLEPKDAMQNPNSAPRARAESRAHAPEWLLEESTQAGFFSVFTGWDSQAHVH